MDAEQGNAEIQRKVRQWHIPLSRGEITLRQAADELAVLGLKQQDVPLIVQLVENPRFDFPGLAIFHGATGLQAHDRIHLLFPQDLPPRYAWA